MKNKRIFFALMALTATLYLSAKIISKRRQKHYSSEEKIRQAEKYKETIKKKQCYPFYYGNHLHRGEPVMLNRRNLSIPTNHLLCGFAGTGKTALMEHEIQSALLKTNDKVFVITGTDEYNGIADGYGGVIKIDKENKPIYIPDDQRLVVCSLEEVRYEVQMQRLSRSILSERYRKCLETIWECVCSNVNSERVSWIFIDDIQDIVCDERCMSVLYDIIIKARTHGCTVTLSTQSLHGLNENAMGKRLLINTNFLTLFALGTEDKDFILSNYKEVLSEPDILFLEVLCEKIELGKGLHIVNGRLIDNENSGNFATIPFDIKL